MSSSTGKLRFQAGFTLIELFAVLAIIGFFITVVISGQSLVKAAKLRTVTLELEAYKEAVHVFRKIYHSWPGDMVDAYDYWGADCASSASACNGDGDDLIQAYGSGEEQYMAWKHLLLAKLIEAPSFSGVDSPLVLGESIPASEVDEAGYWLTRSDTIYGKRDNVLGLGSIGSSRDKFGSALSAEEAEAIDIKIDDGHPDKGDLFIGRGYGESSGKCVDKSLSSNPPITLRQRDQNPTCALYFWLTDIDS